MSEDHLGYLLFKDWIARQEHTRPDWLVVARHTPDEVRSPYSTHSALVPDTAEAREVLFSDVSWGFSPRDAGYPGFNMEREGPVYYGDVASIGPPGFRAFTILRQFPARYARHFELLQEFILYHKACFVDQGEGCWMTFSSTGDDVTIARHRATETGERQIQVSVSALRDFLSAGRWLLVRAHDHRRERPYVALPNDQEVVIATTRDDRRLFEVLVTNRWQLREEEVTLSRLLGFDIVLPFSQVPAERRWWDRGAEQYERFIVGVDDDGSPIERSCGGVEHEEKGVDPAHGITPVYFRLEVLDKYRNDPERYPGGQPAFGNRWGIHHDVNDEGLVQVYLVDLSHIPYPEQRYWKQFNVPPSGGITVERFSRDFLLRPLPPRDLTRRLPHALHHVSVASQQHFGFDLFLPLAPSDAHVEAALHYPISDRAGDFDQQLAALAKLLCESINASQLRTLTGLSIESDGPIKGSIDLLHASLRHLGADADEADRIARPLRDVQSLRSAGTAHRRGPNWARALAKTGLSNMTWPEAHTELLMRLLESLHRIHAFLDSLTAEDDNPPNAPDPA